MFERHDLIILKDNEIPGIVKRQEEVQPGWIELGFSYPVKVDGQRKRTASKAKLEDIEEIITPYEVLKIYRIGRDRIDVLDELLLLAELSGIRMGIFGSLALKIYTGLPYFGEGSDIDIIVKKTSRETLKKFYEGCLLLEEKYSIKIDVEIGIEDGYALKMKEYFRGQKTFLAKGLYDVKLIEINPGSLF